MWAAISTAVVALAAIAATFFAPARVARKIERRREAREFRRSSRLVGHEVRKNRSTAVSFLEPVESDAESIPSIARVGIGFWTEHWDREAGVLASSLSDEDWEDVELAYAKVTATIVLYETVAKLLKLGKNPETDDIVAERRGQLAQLLRSARDDFERARTILEDAEPLTD